MLNFPCFFLDTQCRFKPSTLVLAASGGETGVSPNVRNIPIVLVLPTAGLFSHKIVAVVLVSQEISCLHTWLLNSLFATQNIQLLRYSSAPEDQSNGLYRNSFFKVACLISQDVFQST
jgi:hypothetical protein